MAFDLGALVTRLVVTGQAAFARDIDASERVLARAAISGGKFDAAVSTAAVGTTTLGQRVRVAADNLDAMDESGKRALTTIGTGLVAAGIAVAAVLGVAVAKYAEFDKSISRARAVLGVYGEELDRVRELTVGLGGSTVFTASQAAEGVVELGKAGVETADILGGALKGSLDLAAAGELDVADAAGIASIAMTQFNLAGRDVPHVADLLAAAAGKAQGSVQDLAYGLKQSGLVASQMGLSIEDTTGTLAAFASAGLLGSDAGTSFRTMLLSLATPTKQQAELLKQYNIQAYDQQGNFVGITNLAGQLRTGLGGATQAQRDYALGVIFGSDAIRAANVLYSQGEAGLRRWVSEVNDAGYAARFAAEQQNNLAGDVEKLGGALDSAFIQTGSGANDAIRELVQNVTELVDGFSDLPPELQESLVLGAALTSGVLLLAGGFALALPRALELRAGLIALGVTGTQVRAILSTMFGPWGIAILLAVVTLAQLNNIITGTKATTDELTASLIAQGRTAESIFATYAKGNQKLGDTAAEFARIQDAVDLANNTDVQFFNPRYMNLGPTQENLARIGDELGKLASTDLPAAASTFREFAAETDGSDASLLGLLETMPAYRDQIIAAATANGDYRETLSQSAKDQVLLDYAMGAASSTADRTNRAYREVNGTLVDVTDQVGELVEGLAKLNGENIDSQEAAIRYQDSLRATAAALAENGRTLDITTEAGARNKQALLDQATAAQTAADAALAVDGDYEKYRNTLDKARDQLIANAEAFGMNSEKAQKFADSVLRIPSKAEVQVVLLDKLARERFNRFLADYQNAKIPVSAVVRASDYNADGGVYTQNVRRFAAGGVENHVAQIANAGTVRIWAEPETEGEGYVPFAASKRVRSEQIMQQIAERLGGTYIPSTARRYADGGLIADGTPAGQLVGMRIVGQLDLGGGLTGLIDARIEGALDEQAAARERGYRAP